MLVAVDQIYSEVFDLANGPDPAFAPIATGTLGVWPIRSF